MNYILSHFILVNNLFPNLLYFSSFGDIRNHMAGHPTEILNNCEDVELNYYILEFYELHSIKQFLERKMFQLWIFTPYNSVANYNCSIQKIEYVFIR
jgi:hypothetical protein